MRAVNLLPRDQAPKSRVKKEQLPFVVGGCVGLVVTAILASQYLGQSGKVVAERQALTDLKAQLAALPAPPPGPTAEQTKLASEQSTRLTALETALKTRVAWDRVLREFSLVLPEDVWLSTLNLRSPVSPATGQAPQTSGTPTGITIEGSTYSHDAVARLLSRLATVPDLTNVQLVSSSSTTVGGQDVVHFQIAADIRDPDQKAST
ncbi:MAG TPA: PilN domain-containing protein [Gaiellaceae bacterium]|nr:PilN domain-containing protein [Gaiellaceae bacterium]